MRLAKVLATGGMAGMMMRLRVGRVLRGCRVLRVGRVLRGCRVLRAWLAGGRAVGEAQLPAGLDQ